MIKNPSDKNMICNDHLGVLIYDITKQSQKIRFISLPQVINLSIKLKLKMMTNLWRM